MTREQFIARLEWHRPGCEVVRVERLPNGWVAALVVDGRAEDFYSVECRKP